MSEQETSGTVTGQLIFRDAAMHAPTNDGRKLMMVVGIVAVPRDFEFKGEHQYEVNGTPDGKLTVHLETGNTLDGRVSRGCSLGSLVMEPIWRC